MYDLSTICFLCLNYNNNLEIEIVVNEIFTLIKYALPELAILDLESPLHICSSCHTTLRSFYRFKEKCLENFGCLKNYIKILKGFSDVRGSRIKIKINNYEHQLRKQEDDIYLNNKEELEDVLLSSSETKAHINELQMKINVKQLIAKHEIHEINEETLLSSDERNDQKSDIYDQIDIKEESVASDDKTDVKFYQQLTKCKVLEEAVQDCGPSTSTCEINRQLNKKATTLCILTNNKEFQCSFCKQIFSKECVLARHMKYNSSIKDFECAICNKMFVQNCALKIHMKCHSAIKDFECSICNKKFVQNCELKVHTKYHFNIKDFECSVCSKRFVQNYELKLHMKRHSNIKDFQCSICNKRFFLKSNLTKHMKRHSGIKDFECSICNKTFVKNYELKVHMKYHHSSIKDFECSICNKRFVQNYKLKLHMKRHLNIKDFKCSICSKEFVRKCNLNVHLKRHSGIKDFECSICDKKFFLKSTLKEHLKCHSDITDFECLICNKRFVQNYDLKVHMKGH